MHVRVSRNGGADIDADRGRVDQLNVPYSFRLNGPDVLRHLFPAAEGIQRRDKTFQDQRRLARSRYPGNYSESGLRNAHRERLDRVDPVCLHPDFAVRESTRPRAAPDRLLLPGKVPADDGYLVSFNFFQGSFRNDHPAFCSRFRSHLDKPVGILKDLCIMIDQQNGVSVSHKVMHDAAQADDICRMQPDGRFIQHIQDAGRSVAHRAGKLHSLSLSGG